MRRRVIKPAGEVLACGRRRGRDHVARGQFSSRLRRVPYAVMAIPPMNRTPPTVRGKRVLLPVLARVAEPVAAAVPEPDTVETEDAAANLTITVAVSQRLRFAAAQMRYVSV